MYTCAKNFESWSALDKLAHFLLSHPIAPEIEGWSLAHWR